MSQNPDTEREQLQAELTAAQAAVSRLHSEREEHLRRAYEVARQPVDGQSPEHAEEGAALMRPEATLARIQRLYASAAPDQSQYLEVRDALARELAMTRDEAAVLRDHNNLIDGEAESVQFWRHVTPEELERLMLDNHSILDLIAQLDAEYAQ